MEFQDAVKTCLRKYVSIDRRAARSEVWWFALCVLIGTLAFGIIDRLLSGGWTGGANVPVPCALFSRATFLPAIIARARRLHDPDKAVWWDLPILIRLSARASCCTSLSGKARSGPIVCPRPAGRYPGAEHSARRVWAFKAQRPVQPRPLQ